MYDVQAQIAADQRRGCLMGEAWSGMPKAAFDLGQLVRTQANLGWRGAIIDVDPAYAKDEAWYLTHALRSGHQRKQPWYTVIADDGTPFYLPEAVLAADTEQLPLACHLPCLSAFKDGRYLGVRGMDA